MIVKEGDTIESISKKAFGSAEKADLIRLSNPGTAFSVGDNVIIPSQSVPSQPKNTKGSSIKIDNKTFIGWTSFDFTRSIDSFGTFNFSSVWEPDNQEFRDTFKPFQFKNVGIFEDDELLFNGTMVGLSPYVSPKSKTIAVSGYSLPGVINDCTAPIGLSNERDLQNLEQIAKALIDPFGIPLIFNGDSGSSFEREAIKPDQFILDYLIGLANQKGFIISDSSKGECVFQKEVDVGTPVAVIDEGQAGIGNISPMFNSQQYFSHVSGIANSVAGAPDSSAGGTYTVKNERLSEVLRPFTFKPNDMQGGLKEAVKSKAGRMFANAVSYTVDIPSWDAPSGDMWQPNTTIKIKSPSAMIYSSYEFLIRSVKYSKTSKSKTVQLNLVMPGSFSGKIPEAMPWD